MIKIAVISFPGTNNEVESIRAIKRAGMEPVLLKWNDDPKQFEACDAYFLVGGFSYEDRGRSGMVSARDPVMDVIKAESQKGKVVLGHCNGAQILVESGLIPYGDGLQMSLARNAITQGKTVSSPGFLNIWIHITPGCANDRCASSDWKGTMQIPIAHGEGRFTTRDSDLLKELEKNDQIAFRYCDASGVISDDPSVTPNGSMHSIAGICNPTGNVIALMPHPERTRDGDVYFASVKKWIEEKRSAVSDQRSAKKSHATRYPLPAIRSSVEIFIDTLITNNEERTVEQALKRKIPTITLKQYRFFAPTEKKPEELLTHVSFFNPHKEVAYIRSGNSLMQWDPATKKAIKTEKKIFTGTVFVRRDDPNIGAEKLGKGSMSGICYDCRSVNASAMEQPDVLAILANPHASTLMTLVS